MPKKGGFIDLNTMFSSGIGAYAAKNSSSMGELLLTLAKYALVVIGLLILVFVILGLFRIGTESFVPTTPSPEGDKKAVTPAGNVIMY